MFKTENQLTSQFRGIQNEDHIVHSNWRGGLEEIMQLNVSHMELGHFTY